MTLTISLTWVARFTLPSMRCERSPNPVIVGVTPCARAFAEDRPRAPAPAGRARRRVTSTKVFGAPVCAGLARCPERLRSRRRLRLPARPAGHRSCWLQSSCLLRVVFGSILLGTRPFVPNSANGKRFGMLACPPYPPPPTLWITGTIAAGPVSVRRGLYWRSSDHSARFMRFPLQFLDELRARLPVSEGRRPARAAQEGGA